MLQRFVQKGRFCGRDVIEKYGIVAYWSEIKDLTYRHRTSSLNPRQQQ